MNKKYGICSVCDSYLQEDSVCPECDIDITPVFDPVQKPYHYNHTDGIECIDYIRQVLGTDGFVAYCRGNVMKYNHRAFYKGNPTEDMNKAAWYLNQANLALKEKHK